MLEVVVTIETERGGVGKTRTELEEERTEGLIEHVAIDLIDRRGCAMQAGIADARGPCLLCVRKGVVFSCALPIMTMPSFPAARVSQGATV